MREHPIVMAAAVWAGIWIGCGTMCQAAEAPTTALQVGANAIEVSQEEFETFLIEQRKSGDMLKAIETLTPEGRSKLLSVLIERKLMAAEARRLSMDREPQVKRRIDSTVETVLAKELRTRTVDGLALTESRLREFYRQHPDDFRMQKRVKARHIIVKSHDESQQALQDIKDGQAFNIVANKVNIDSSKNKGGDLGWVIQGVMVEPFDEALFSLAPGQISEIVATSFGFHIIQVEEIDPGAIKPFEQVQTQVKQLIIDRHMAEMIERLKRKIPIKIDDSVVKDLSK